MCSQIRPFIENVSYEGIKYGIHYDAGYNSVLIQITDYDSAHFPIPKYKFKEIHQFKFWDLEPEGLKSGHALHNGLFNKQQAKEVVGILKNALENNMNVIVHCHAGLCRSGAIAEVGVQLGFMDTTKLRIPNQHVKKLLMEELNGNHT